LAAKAPFVAGEGWEKNEDGIATNSLYDVGRSLPQDGNPANCPQTWGDILLNGL
jgi:hypothetical protein